MNMSRPIDDNLDYEMNNLNVNSTDVNNLNSNINEYEAQVQEYENTANQLDNDYPLGYQANPDLDNDVAQRRDDVERQRQKIEEMQAEIDKEKEKLRQNEALLEEEENKNNMNGMNHADQEKKKEKNEHFKSNAKKRQEEKEKIEAKKAEQEDIPDPEYNKTIDKEEVIKQADDMTTMIGVIRNLESIFRGSKEFADTRYQVGELDKFMQKVKGRSTLSNKELNEYARITDNIVSNCNKYLNKKDKEVKSRKKNGKELSAGEFEENRIKGITMVRNKVQKMRGKMFKKYFEEKRKDMEAVCKDKQQEINDKLALLEDIKDPDEKKEKYRELVIEALFYVNRIASLSKKEAFRVQPGETFVEANKRLEKSLTPTEAEKKEIRENEFVDKMVEEGYDDFLTKSGDYTTEDIIKVNKNVVRKEGDRIRRERIREEQMNKSTEKNKEKEKNRELTPGNNTAQPSM